MAQLIVIADTHCQYDVIEAAIARERAADPGTSAVLHCGDAGLYDSGSLTRLPVRERMLIEKHGNPVHLAFPYTEGRADLGLPVLCIPGNHEDFELVGRLERGELTLPALRLLLPGEVAGVPLGDGRARVMGLGRIMAQVGSAHPHRAKYIQPEHLDAVARAGEADPPDVLLLHDPPALAIEGQRGDFGNRSLAALIERVRPRVVLAGHMHFEYRTEVAGVPVIGLGYGVKGRYGVLDEALRFHFRDLAGRPPAPRTVGPAPAPEAPPDDAARRRARLQRMPLPITARQIVERLGLGRLKKAERRALDAFLAELRAAYVTQGGMTEEEAWAMAKGFVVARASDTLDRR